MNITIALIGNPNCGKTTLFNTLTGTYQKTGNWSGVTTEKKEGEYRKDKRIKIVDLPGIYSLEPKSDDEVAVIDFFKNTPPDVIINVLDGTSLERNLYLTMELSALKIPTVVAVNMCDELEKNGVIIDYKEFASFLGVNVVPISALKGKNIDELIEIAKKVIDALKTPVIAQNGDLDDVELRYQYIERHLNKIITKKQTKAEIVTQKIDNIIMHKIFSIPIFICVIFFIYFSSIKLGGLLGGQISLWFDNLSSIIRSFFVLHKVPDWITSLTCDAIVSGLGTVLSFFPQIIVLFALLAVVEESGYSARIAFILDRFLRAFGLGGKSFIPLIVSCGCTVSGIMATRTIDNASEKRMTIFLTPFMPCGAKMAVFGWFSYAFFNGSALIATSMYFLSIICVAVFGCVLKNFKNFKTGKGIFVLEIPTLRIPSIKDVFLVLVEKTKDFMTKAGMIVFITSVILWALTNLGVHGYTFGEVENSFLYAIGNFIKWIFYPLGFGNWQSSVAIITGLMAKESVVETLVLLSTDVQSLFNSWFSVYAFMAFILLSPPCMATIATAKRELKSVKWTLLMIIFQFVSAYAVALIINAIGILLNLQIGLILSVFTVIIVTLTLVIFIVKLKKRKCGLCKACKKGGQKCLMQNQSTIE